MATSNHGVVEVFRRYPRPEIVTAHDIGCAVVGADAQRQAAIFRAMVDDVAGWRGAASWPMQCRSLAFELDAEYRVKLAALLGTLVDHLMEPAESSFVKASAILDQARLDGIGRATDAIASARGEVQP
jgi:hypothetical protein